ncbi:MAG: metallophosphoesterase [Lachnospiraceae bacterium]|nr:metallophosphoesterase [Lachnospiraceae bacterium]
MNQSIKIPNTICAFALAFTLGIPYATPVTVNCSEVVLPPSITYDFAYDTAGSATGTITLSHVYSNDITYLYWGDGNNNILKKGSVEYSAITSVSEKINEQKYAFNSNYAAIPQGAKQLLLEDNSGKIICSYTIPESKLLNLGTPKYEFALMSDVHYNRYPKEGSAIPENEDIAVTAFNNALAFVSKSGIDSVFLTGDLSNQGEIDSYNKFNKAISNYPNMTVYTCMGNHDVSWTKSATAMVEQFTKNVNTKKSTDNNVKEIAPNNLDFVYEKSGDYFIFLSQTKAIYGSGKSLLDDTQLNWLEKMLNRYANKKVYLFFHTYLSRSDANERTAVGNLENPAGYYYDLTYPVGSTDEVRIKSLLTKYSNVTFFSGHSHWAQDQIKYNANLMIGTLSPEATGATLVHIPSVTAPRTIEPTSTKRDENAGDRSEGIIATRYDNYTLYTGVDFKNGKYLGYSVFLNADGKKTTPVPELKLSKGKIKKIAKAKKVSKKSKKYKITIKFAKVKNAKKYELQYSTNKKFKASKTKAVETKKTSVTIKNLKAKSKYYVRVRAYGSQFGEKVYGKWSPKKIVKTPKK